MTNPKSADAGRSGDLKPCPFCKGEARVARHRATDEVKYWAVDCLQYPCDIQGPCAQTEAEAIVAWNNRPADSIEALGAEVEGLGSVVDALLQHDASSFWGADAEKNRRASYRGVIRKAKKVRAALGEK